MRTMARLGLCLLLVALVVSFCGCWELLSWSPDGRYLYLIDPDQTRLWRWDTETQAAESMLPDTEISCAFPLPGNQLVYLAGTDDESSTGDDAELVWRDFDDGSWRVLLQHTSRYAINISPDAHWIYAVRVKEENDAMEMVRFDLTNLDHSEVVIESAKLKLDVGIREISFPMPNTGGDKVLFVGNRDEAEVEYQGLYLYDKKSGDITKLQEDGASDAFLLWPRWVGEDEAVVVSGKDSDDEEGKLILVDTGRKRTRELASRLYPYSPPAFDQARNRMIITQLVEFSDDEQAQEWYSAWQLVAVDLDSGKREQLTFEPFGAGYPAMHPTRNEVAYMSPPDIDSDWIFYGIRDLDARDTTFIWRNDEQRLFAAAREFVKAGNARQAEQTYAELLKNFPETRFAEPAAYQLMLLYLDGPLENLDLAFDNWMKAGSNLRDQAYALFWREEDKLATDPANDLLRSYGSEQSREAFGYDTDLTRDLRALWARTSAENLYLRLDMNSPQDLTGLTFCDFILLFDTGTPGEGLREITPAVQWDHGAECRITLQHWYDNGEQSQYNVAIAGADGEIVSHFEASGFPGAQYPGLRIIDTWENWTAEEGSLILSVPLKFLKAESGREISLQVCTAKGGVESFKQLERPRETPEDGPAGFDIADAFGEQNTAKRIEQALEQGETPHIEGAVSLRLESQPGGDGQ